MKRLLLPLLLLTACPHGGSGREPDEYTGCSTDEVWRVFDDNTAVANDAQAPQIGGPPPSSVAFSPKIVLTWTQTPTITGPIPDGDVPYMNGPGCDNCCPQFNRGALTTMHLPAISGNVYDLQLSVSGAVVHRVLTTLQSWTPTDALWASLAGKTVEISLSRMTVLRNDRKEGPFRRTMPVTVTVQSP